MRCAFLAIPWTALWLAVSGVAAEWRQEAGYRSRPLDVPAGGKTGFTVVDPATLGIDFSNLLSPQRAQAFQNMMNGSGLAAADVDGDGLVDLYFCHKQSANQLYRNLGQGRFENITARAGVACTNQVSVGAVFADVNGDGAPDLLVSSFGGPHTLLLNDGKGRFTDATAASGLSSKTGATSIALGDVDGDGDLDVYWCNFGVQTILRDGGVISTRMVNGKPVVTGRYANRVRIIDGILHEFGEPHVLALNDGAGHFKPVAWEQTFTDAEGKPVTPAWDMGLAVQIRDTNGDGHPDIYVCNDFQTPDHLWLGDGRGKFREASTLALRTMSRASMGVDFADLDRDGWLDFVTAEMPSHDLRRRLRTLTSTQPAQAPPGSYSGREDMARNALFHARGDGSYDEIAPFAGVAATSWSWTPLLLDVDLDGWEDLLISNGHPHDVDNRDIGEQTAARPGQSVQPTKDKLLQYPPLEPPKFAFRNRRDLTFENVSQAWGFDSTRIVHGLIAADLDGDGDLDVIGNAFKGPPLIWRNESSAPRVAVRLRGTRGNPTGVGAMITLTGGPVIQQQEILAGGQYLSHSEPLRVFAAGSGEMTLEVRWRSGKRSVVRGVQANHLYEVDETAATEAPPPAPPPVPQPLFADSSAQLPHRHTEVAFNDFEQQPLLPQRYSQLGPFVLATDLNQDAHADLLLGSGRGGRLAALAGDGKGGFTPLVVGGTEAADDLLGLAVLPLADGQPGIVAALANYETGGEPTSAAALRWHVRTGELQPAEPLPGGPASSGPLAVDDVDADGDLDLFLGARLTARRWPEPGGSRWFRNDGVKLVWDEAASRAFAGVGPVSDARFVDLTGDGRSELVLACELGSVRIFHWREGQWQEADFGVRAEPQLGVTATRLRDLTGWWSCLAPGDFDGDGRLDLLVGNHGLNTHWQIWGDHRPTIVAAEAGDGSLAVIEAVQDSGALRPLRDRNTLSRSLPDLSARFSTHAAYAEADVARVLGPAQAKARTWAVSTLASVVLLNRGDSFVAVPLPAAAQWTPVSAFAVADFDGDGQEDAFVSQNLFAVRPDDWRLDSGRGLLLRGDGRGGFAPMPGQASGLAVYGEQRGAVAADFDEDGRTDLVVTQNGAETRLFRNQTAPPGLRVRLAGPSGNPAALGAVVRPSRGGQLGSAKLCAGAELILGGPRPDTLEVRWPGGQRTSVPVPAQGAVVIQATKP